MRCAAYGSGERLRPAPSKTLVIDGDIRGQQRPTRSPIDGRAAAHTPRPESGREPPPVRKTACCRVRAARQLVWRGTGCRTPRTSPVC
eukprot:ctg_1092.g243